MVGRKEVVAGVRGTPALVAMVAAELAGALTVVGREVRQAVGKEAV